MRAACKHGHSKQTGLWVDLTRLWDMWQERRSRRRRRWRLPTGAHSQETPRVLHLSVLVLVSQTQPNIYSLNKQLRGLRHTTASIIRSESNEKSPTWNRRRRRQPFTAAVSRNTNNTGSTKLLAVNGEFKNKTAAASQLDETDGHSETDPSLQRSGYAGP